MRVFEHQLGLSDPLSGDIRQYCSNEIVAAAATALENEEDRQAFLRDVTEVREALKIS